MKDEVFFGEKGLTSTSANTYANLAKEMQQAAESELRNMQFYTTTINLLGSHDTQLIEKATTKESLSQLVEKLDFINHLKQLQAWLREAIKAKESLTKYYRYFAIEDWAKQEGVKMPEDPVYKEHLTEKDWWDSLTADAQARYYNVETTCSTLGKYIHPGNTFAKAREVLQDRLNHPHIVSGNGRDTIIYNYEVEEGMPEEVEKVFFELQAKHREAQKELNSMRFKMEEAIQESVERANIENSEARAEYLLKLEKVQFDFKAWREKKLAEVKNLKIIVPASLSATFNAVKLYSNQ